MVSLEKSLHSKLFHKLLSQGYICFMYSEKVELRCKSIWKSEPIQKCNGFVTIGFVVLTNFTKKVDPSNKLINTNISVMICMIFTLRLPKTKWVYYYFFFLPLQYLKILFLQKCFFPYFNSPLLRKWPQSMFYTKCVFTMALSILTQIPIKLI